MSELSLRTLRRAVVVARDAVKGDCPKEGARPKKDNLVAAKEILVDRDENDEVPFRPKNFLEHVPKMHDTAHIQHIASPFVFKARIVIPLEPASYRSSGTRSQPKQDRTERFVGMIKNCSEKVLRDRSSGSRYLGAEAQCGVVK